MRYTAVFYPDTVLFPVALELPRMYQSQMVQLPLNCPCLHPHLPHPMTTDEIIEKFQLDTIKNQVWHVQESSFTTGDGIYEGIDWIIEHIPKN